MDGDQYAVNLGAMMELTRDSKTIGLLALLQGIVIDEPFCPVSGKDWSHQALPVKDDVTEERWNAIVHLIRQHYRYHEFPLYRRTKRGWRTVR